jgi:hypothetical protein
VWVRRLTSKPWFGPKRFLGWGLTIASWQGAVVTITAGALVIASVAILRPLVVGIAVAVAILIVFVYVALRTGDPPGGPTSSRLTRPTSAGVGRGPRADGQ